MTQVQAPPVAAPSPPVEVPGPPQVGLVFRDGAEVVLARTDARVAELVAVAGTLAPPPNPARCDETPRHAGRAAARRTTGLGEAGEGAGPVVGSEAGDGEGEDTGSDVVAATPGPPGSRRGRWTRLVARVRRLLTRGAER